MQLNYKNFTLFLFVLLLPVNSAVAKVTQQIDRSDISAGETFVLEIQTDTDTSDSPDLSMIPSNFTIVSSSQYQNTQIINGKRSFTKGWKIKLKTLKSGNLTIPSIPVGNESTKPVKLKIKPASSRADVNGQNKAIFLTAEVDQKAPYVQQQVIYTVSLFRSVNTHYENLSVPQVEGSIVEKLGDDQVFEKEIDGKRYAVFQRKYVIFPQQSGQMEISPVNFTADVNDNKRRGSYFLNSTRPVSVTSQPIQLSVKPKPIQAKSPWLPAEMVSLSDHWSNDGQPLKVGEPTTWTLSLKVQGLSESQLPEITMPQLEGLQLYPDAPQKERQINQAGLLSERIEKFAVIPSKPGQITIPPIEINWWDTSSNSQKTARLPSKSFEVIAASPVSKPAQALPKPLTAIADNNKEQNSSQVKQWQVLSAGLALLWLITLVAYFNKTAASSKTSLSESENKNEKLISSQKKVLKEAKAAIKNGSYDILEATIIKLVNQVCSARGSANQYHSLGAVIQSLSSQSLTEKLAKLEQQRYSNNDPTIKLKITNLDLEQLIKEFSTQRKNASYSTIPPLYAK